MKDVDPEEILREVRQLKTWLIGASLLLAFCLGAIAAIYKFTDKALNEALDAGDKATYTRAQYEQQKTQIYRLENRVTDGEIEMKSRLKPLEKIHE